MKPEEFAELRAEALKHYKAQTGKEPKVGLDTIFLSLVNARQSSKKPAQTRVADEAPPAWFDDTLKKLRKTKESVTVGRFLLLANQFPATRADSLKVAKWLREAGVKSRKTGGNLIFDMD
jgi:hypothetical protein